MTLVSSHIYHDAVIALLWVAINVLLVHAACRFRDAAIPGPPGARRILDAAVIYCATIVFVLTLIGTIGLFSGVAMLVGVALAAVGGLAIARRLSAGASGRSDQFALQEIGSSSRVFSAAWLILFGLLCGHVIVNGLLRFPTDFDSLMYHMPLINHWLQAGSLYAPDSASWWVPGNSELLAAWAAGPFSGDFLVPLNNVPVVIVWAAAAVELARHLGMTGTWPHLAAIATLSVHTLLHETDDASNDLMVGAFCLASAAYTLRFLSSRRMADLVLFGVAAGLLAGVKYFALGYAAVCFAVLGLGLILIRDWKTMYRSVAIASTIAVPFGGYWYIRNIIATGLPLYPMGMTNATANLGYPDIWSTSFWGNGHPQLLELGMDAVWRMCGPVHYLTVVATPAVALLLLGFAVRLYLTNKEDPITALKPLLLATWLLGTGAVLLVTPLSVEDQPGTLNHLRWAYTPVRYGLSYLSFSVLSMFVLLDQVSCLGGAWLRKLTPAFLAALCAWQIALRIWTTTAEFEFEIAAIAGVDVILLMLVSSKIMHTRSALGQTVHAMLAVSILAATSTGVAFLSGGWHRGFVGHFDQFFNTSVFSQIDEKFPDRARIVVFDSRPYAFFGAARQHHVFQPRFFRSRHWLDEIMIEREPDVLATASVERGAFNRYRGTSESIANIPSFTKVSEIGYFRVFFASVDPESLALRDKSKERN